jgi:HPt (histidine-containing phosphotransfer) domain-containing protein
MKARLPRDGRAQLEALRRAYGEDLPRRVRAIEEAAARLHGAALRPEALEAAYHLVHRLSGSSAIYGFEAVRRAAAALETRLASAMEAGAPAGNWEAELAPHLEALRRAVSAPPASGQEK